MGAVAQRGRRAASSARSSPIRATSLVGERWKSSARSRWAKARGGWRAGLAKRREDALGLALVARARRSAPRGAAGPARPSCCRRGSGGRRSPCGGRSAPRGRRRSRRSRRARGRRSGRSSSSASARASLEPARLEGRFVERQQRLEQEGVVLEVGVEVGAAVLVGAQQAAVRVAQLARARTRRRRGRRRGSPRGRARRRPRPGRRSSARSRR